MLLLRWNSLQFRLQFFLYFTLAMKWLQLEVSFSFCNDLKLFQIAGLLRQMSISFFAYFTSGMTSFGVKWVKLSSLFLDDSHRNTIFFPRENVSFCVLSKLFSRWISSECATFFAFSWKKNVKFVCKIFSADFAHWTSQIVAIFNLRDVCKIFQTERSFQTAENEGSFLMSKPRNGPNRGRFISVLLLMSYE